MGLELSNRKSRRKIIESLSYSYKGKKIMELATELGVHCKDLEKYIEEHKKELPIQIEPSPILYNDQIRLIRTESEYRYFFDRAFGWILAATFIIIGFILKDLYDLFAVLAIVSCTLGQMKYIGIMRKIRKRNY